MAHRIGHHQIFGLSYGDANQDYSEIDYASEMESSGTPKKHELGDHVGNFGSYSVCDMWVGVPVS
jgi:hypothetical protein